MPPRIPLRICGSATPSHSLSTPNPRLNVRSFTATTAPRALGPESPNYIEVPKPLQPTGTPKRIIKGVLPTPRNVFKTRSDLPKESDEFLKLSTPDPAKPPMPGKYNRDAEIRLYKQRLADSRKLALRQGVKELHERKTTTEQKERADMKVYFAERRAAAMAPPREVDVLTQTSVSKSIRDFLEDKLPSTSRLNITDARRKAFKRRMAKHQSVREARLHDMYTKAREFIVNEEQLDAAIEQEFGTEEAPVGWDGKGQQVVGQAGEFGKSPWAGPMPEGVAELLKKLKGGEGVGLARERMKKVAEELTGGKM